MCAAETEALTSRAEQEFRHNALMAKKEQEVSLEEQRRRQEFLRAQREKLLEQKRKQRYPTHTCSNIFCFFALRRSCWLYLLFINFFWPLHLSFTLFSSR